MQSGRLTSEEMERRLARLTPSIDLKSLAQADLVIEAVFEDMAVKQATFRELDRVVKDGGILASNTSYLNLDALAAVTARPADVVVLTDGSMLISDDFNGAVYRVSYGSARVGQ